MKRLKTKDVPHLEDTTVLTLNRRGSLYFWLIKHSRFRLAKLVRGKEGDAPSYHDAATGHLITREHGPESSVVNLGAPYSVVHHHPDWDALPPARPLPSYRHKPNANNVPEEHFGL